MIRTHIVSQNNSLALWILRRVFLRFLPLARPFKSESGLLIPYRSSRRYDLSPIKTYPGATGSEPRALRPSVRPIMKRDIKQGCLTRNQSGMAEYGAAMQRCIWIVFNTMRPRQNGRRFADDTFKRIFVNENVIISIKISLKFVPKGPINNNPALVQKMAWHRSGNKPLSVPMMVSLLTHICVTRPQWVKIVQNQFT